MQYVGEPNISSSKVTLQFYGVQLFHTFPQNSLEVPKLAYSTPKKIERHVLYIMYHYKLYIIIHNHTILVRFYHLPSFWDAVAGEVGFPAWHDTAQHLFEGSDG